MFMFYWVQQGGSPSLLPFFFVLFLLEALPTCVIVWPLSACLLQSAVLCSSPHSSLPLALCLPADSYRLASLLFLPPGPPGQEQLFQNWPTCNKFTTTAAPESVLSNLHFHSLYLSCKDHFSQRWRCLMFFFFFLVSL